MPSVAEHWVIKFANASVDPSNYQICDIDFAVPGPTVSQVAAQILAYFAGQCTLMSADDTVIVGLDYTPSGAAGGTPVPFPSTDYAAEHTAYPALPNLTAYGQNVGGAGFLAPLGTSVSVSEHTASPGPSGRGRHFIPFVGRDCCSTAGFLNPGTIIDSDDNYGRFFFDVFSDGPFAAYPNPVVTNALRTTTKDIVSVKTQQIFSNLESRRR